MEHQIKVNLEQCELLLNIEIRKRDDQFIAYLDVYGDASEKDHIQYYGIGSTITSAVNCLIEATPLRGEKNE